MTIVPPAGVITPTNYVNITYSNIDYNNTKKTFELETTGPDTGQITVASDMTAQITYVTVVRCKTNDDYSCFVKLQKNTNGNWLDISNTNVSASIKGDKSLKQTCTGSTIIDLSANDKIRASICITRVTGALGASDALYVTKGTSISIVDFDNGDRLSLIHI